MPTNFYLSELTHILGLSLKLPVWLIVQLSGISLGILVHVIDGYIESYVWCPSLTYYLMVILLLADFVTGTLYALQCHAFQTRKALRSVWKLVANTFLLGIAFNLGQSERLFAWLPEAVLVPMILFLLLSALKNMSLLGWLEPRLAKLLYRHIDTYKNPQSPLTNHAEHASSDPYTE